VQEEKSRKKNDVWLKKMVKEKCVGQKISFQTHKNFYL
jgi:hypothetical protein